MDNQSTGEHGNPPRSTIQITSGTEVKKKHLETALIRGQHAAVVSSVVAERTVTTLKCHFKDNALLGYGFCEHVGGARRGILVIGCLNVRHIWSRSTSDSQVPYRARFLSPSLDVHIRLNAHSVTQPLPTKMKMKNGKGKYVKVQRITSQRGLGTMGGHNKAVKKI